MAYNESSTESAIYDLFEPPLFPKVPILDGLRNKPVSFIYGEYDWVTSVGAEVLVTAAQQGPFADQSNLYVIPGAEH